MGIQSANSRSLARKDVTTVGHCVECKNGIFSDQEWVWVRRPSTGRHHARCVPSDAVLEVAS